MKPITIEDARETDNTFVFSMDNELEDEEECDEFSPFFKELRQSKLFLTTSKNPRAETYKFLKELKEILPNCFYYDRK